MTYQIIVSDEALAQLAKLPKPVAAKLITRIRELAEEPIPHNAKKLKGYELYYRIRYSEWRITYGVYHNELLVEVIRTGHRSTIYDTPL